MRSTHPDRRGLLRPGIGAADAGRRWSSTTAGFAIVRPRGGRPARRDDPFGLSTWNALPRPWELRIDGEFPLLLRAAATERRQRQVVDVTNTDGATTASWCCSVTRGGATEEGAVRRRAVRAPGAAQLRRVAGHAQAVHPVHGGLRRHVRGARRRARAARHASNRRVSRHRRSVRLRGPGRCRVDAQLVFAPRRAGLEERPARFALSLPPQGANALRATIACTGGRAPAARRGADAGRRGRRPRASARARRARAVPVARVLERRVRRWVDALAARSRPAPHRRTAGRTSTPAFPGSRPFRARRTLTALETLAFAPELAAASCAPWPRCRAGAPTGAGRGARQDRARAARRRDGGDGRGAVRPLLRQRRRDAAVSRAARRLRRSDRRLELVRGAVARGDRGASSGWTHQPRRARATSTYARREPPRPRQPGLEGLARRDQPRGRNAGRAARSRCPRCRDTCTARSTAWRSSRRSDDETAWRALATSGRRPAGAVRPRLLAGRPGHVRAGARPRRTPVPRRRLERRPMPVRRHREPEHAAAGRAAHARRHLLRLGPPHAVRRALRFNPMSYHNGSVWPHDNALIAAGIARYGSRGGAAVVLSGLSTPAGLRGSAPARAVLRLRRARSGAARAYPVACTPQAWAAGSVLLLIQAVAGVDVDARQRRVTLRGHPAAVAPAPGGPRLAHPRRQLDLRVVRGRRSAAVEVVGRSGEVDVVVRK